MAKVIFSIGAPGSGKSTALKKLATDISATYICPDEIRKELFGDEVDHSDDKKVWQIARDRVAESVKNKHAVVFDSTHTRLERRKAFIEEVRAMGATSIEGIFFNLPVEEILKRNAARDKKVDEDYIRLSVDRLKENPPIEAEGFDALTVISE